MLTDLIIAFTEFMDWYIPLQYLPTQALVQKVEMYDFA
jgi:hypothetical protein